LLTTYVYVQLGNAGPQTLYSTRLVVTYYGAGDTIMGVGEGYTHLSMIRPGEFSTAEILTQPQVGWQRYTIGGSWATSSYTTYVHDGLTLSGLSTYRTGDVVYVVGTLKNDTGQPVRFPRVDVGIYAGDGTIVDTDGPYVNGTNDLAPGGSSPFSASFFDFDRRIPSGYAYSIHAEGWR
jgi:hypothetical protein